MLEFTDSLQVLMYLRYWGGPVSSILSSAKIKIDIQKIQASLQRRKKKVQPPALVEYGQIKRGVGSRVRTLLWQMGGIDVCYV